MKNQSVATLMTEETYNPIQPPEGVPDAIFTYMIPIKYPFYSWVIRPTVKILPQLRKSSGVTHIDIIQDYSAISGEGTDEIFRLGAKISGIYTSKLHGGTSPSVANIVKLPYRAEGITDHDACTSLVKPIRFPESLNITPIHRKAAKLGAPIGYFIAVTGTTEQINKFLLGIRLLTNNVDTTTTSLKYIPILKRFAPLIRSDLPTLAVHCSCYLSVMSIDEALDANLPFGKIDPSVYNGAVVFVEPLQSTEAMTDNDDQVSNPQPLEDDSSSDDVFSIMGSDCDSVDDDDGDHDHDDDTSNEENSEDNDVNSITDMNDDETVDDVADNNPTHDNTNEDDDIPTSTSTLNTAETRSSLFSLFISPFQRAFAKSNCTLVASMSRNRRLSEHDLPLSNTNENGWMEYTRHLSRYTSNIINTYTSSSKTDIDRETVQGSLPFFYLKVYGTPYQLTLLHKTLLDLFTSSDKGNPYSTKILINKPDREYFTYTFHIPLQVYTTMRFGNHRFFERIADLNLLHRLKITTRLTKTQVVLLTVSTDNSHTMTNIYKFIAQKVSGQIKPLPQPQIDEMKIAGITESIRTLLANPIERSDDVLEEIQTLNAALPSRIRAFPASRAERFFYYFTYYVEQGMPQRLAVKFATYYLANSELVPF